MRMVNTMIPTRLRARVQVQAGTQDVRIIARETSANGSSEAVVGKPVPEFPVSKWLHRQAVPNECPFAREDFRGKVVLLAFLDEAKPSQRLVPQLNELHTKLSERGLLIVRVQEAAPNSQEKAEVELAKLSPTVAAVVPPGLLAGGYSEAFHKYGVKAAPVLFLIDRQGVLRYSDVEADALVVRCQELLKP